MNAAFVLEYRSLILQKQKPNLDSLEKCIHSLTNYVFWISF